MGVLNHKIRVTARFSVILSAAKDLMAIATGALVEMP
jgi:hypothetical protein